MSDHQQTKAEQNLPKHKNIGAGNITNN